MSDPVRETFYRPVRKDRLGPLWFLYRVFEAATPWIAAAEFLLGFGMALATILSAIPFPESWEVPQPFTFPRADAFLGALAGWTVLAHEGYTMGREEVKAEVEG